MKRSLFRYYGGKHRLAPWIIEHFPEHRVYIEPFCGAASVFFRKERSYAEVLNDASGEIINYFRVLQDKVRQTLLKELLIATPYSREEFENAFDITDDPVERARRLVIRANMGFYADSVNPKNTRGGFRNDCNRRSTLPCHNWATYPQFLDEFAERLRGVIIENMDVFDLFEKYSRSNDILWYLDPPYVKATRSKQHRSQYFVEFADDEHRKLVDRIMALPGTVILSGYPNDLYAPIEEAGWRRVSKWDNNNAFGGSGSRLECLWINKKGGAKSE